MNAPVLRLNAAKSRKVIAAARLLDSDKPGEVIASVNAINRLLPDGQRVADVLAQALTTPSPPRAAPRPHWWSVAQFCACHLDELNNVEHQFVIDMAHRNTRPSEKQEAWLGRIHADLNRRAV